MNNFLKVGHLYTLGGVAITWPPEKSLPPKCFLMFIGYNLTSTTMEVRFLNGKEIIVNKFPEKDSLIKINSWYENFLRPYPNE